MPRITTIETIAEHEQEIQPLTQLPRSDTSTPLEFKIPESFNEVIHPLMHLLMRIRVRKYGSDGIRKELSYPKDRVCLINWIAMTMWDCIDVSFNGLKVTANHVQHALIALLRGFMEFTKEQKDNYLSMGGWYPDEGTDLINDQRHRMTCQSE